jgi:nitroreductase
MSDYQNLSRILHARHSCRAFRPDRVPREEIEKIVTAAQRVPSWCNAQPWQVAITGAKETERLRTALFQEVERSPAAPDIPFPSGYTGPYRERRRTCGWQLYEAVGVEKGDRAASAEQMRENFRFFGAPHIALVTTEAELGPYGFIDCGGFITAFALAAQALGIGTIPQAAVAAYSPFLHRWFGLPENRQILCSIAFGYCDTEHPANGFRTGRAALGEVIDWRD